jgi:hypothetical protein
MDYGADDFAVKPMSLESLINKVNMKLLEDAKKCCFCFCLERKVLPPHTSLCVLLLLSNIPPAPPTLRNFIINALPPRYHLLYI